MGLSPFEAPATFSLMPYTELAHGVWYPKGGMYSVVETLTDLAREAGVEFIFNSAVERIDTEFDARPRRSVLQMDRALMRMWSWPMRICPMFIRICFRRMGWSRHLSRKRFSCSVISFFWGVDKTYEALGPHTLFLADDYRENFESIDRDLGLPANPSLYIHAPARLDPSMAPRGQDTLTAIVPVGHMSENGEQDWGELRDRGAPAGISPAADSRHYRPRIAHQVRRDVYTPLSWRKRYNLVKGSTHGLSHTLTQMAYFRPSNRHPRYQNLYFVGASTHPGTGMPTAMVSGRLAAERIMDELS